ATSLKVVSSPTISYSSRPRSRCRAQALSFPLLQESRIRFIVGQPARAYPNHGPLKLFFCGERESVRERFPPVQQPRPQYAAKGGSSHSRQSTRGLFWLWCFRTCAIFCSRFATNAVASAVRPVALPTVMMSFHTSAIVRGVRARTCGQGDSVPRTAAKSSGDAAQTWHRS